jgi:hypothetical protein
VGIENQITLAYMRVKWVYTEFEEFSKHRERLPSLPVVQLMTLKN